MAAYIIADKRERDVMPHLHAAMAGRVVEHQINTGDFLLCRATSGVAGLQIETVAIFERKTIADFVSSFNDGRYENRKKMMERRAGTGCQLYFIVEGPAFCSPSWKIGRNTTYKSIMSAMISLPLACGIGIIQTKNPQHTAETLRDWADSLDKIAEPYWYPIDEARSSGQAGSEAPGGDAHGEAAAAGTLVPEAVTGRYEKDPDTEAMEMWNKLPGISITTAKQLVGICSVWEFMASGVTGKPIINPNAFRTANGKLLVKRGRESLQNLLRGGRDAAQKLLSGMPGVSHNMAGHILDAAHKSPESTTGDLRAIMVWGIERFAAVDLPQKGRTVKLGRTRAEKIYALLKWRGEGKEPEPLTPATYAAQNFVPAQAAAAIQATPAQASLPQASSSQALLPQASSAQAASARAAASAQAAPAQAVAPTYSCSEEEMRRAAQELDSLLDEL